MVEDESEHVLALAQHEQACPHRDPPGQVEPGPHGVLELGVEIRRFGHLQLDADADAGVGVGGLEDPLVRDAVLLVEHRAQHLVPGDDVTQRGPQRRCVQLTGQPQHQRYVVGRGAALEAVQEPEPLLGRGQRQPFRTRAGGELGPHGPGPVAAAGTVDDGRQRRDSWRLEHRPHLQGHVQLGAHPRDQPGGQQRVPTEGEEVVVGADPLEGQDLRVQLGEPPLGRGGRRAVRGRRDRVRRRQRLAVQLAVRGEGQLVEHDERRGHHVVGQRAGRPGAHLRDQLGVRMPAHRVAGEHRGLAGPEGAGERIARAHDEHVQVTRAGTGPRAVRAQPVPLGHLPQLGRGQPGVLDRLRLRLRLRHRRGRGTLVQVRQRDGGRRRARVRDAVEAQRPVEQRVQLVEAVHVGAPGQLAVHLGRGDGIATEHDVVAVSGQLVCVVRLLDPDLGGAQRPEELGRDQQFLVPVGRAVDRAAQRPGVGVRFRRERHRRVERAQLAQVADVADEHGTAGREQLQRPAQHPLQVVGAREVLHHRVDHDRVEVPGR